MEVQFTVHQGVSDPAHSAEVRDFLSGHFSRSPEIPALPFDRDELVSSICRLNRRRAPGPDPVSYTHLDVYKRQLKNCLSVGTPGEPMVEV